MKRGFFSIVLMVILIAAIIIIPMLNIEETVQTETGTSVQSLQTTLVESKISGSERTDFLPGDKVTFIVELSSSCLLDCFNADYAYETVTDYALSDEGISQLQEILRQQALVKAEIKRMVGEADFSNTVSYKTVVNAFTVQAYYSSLEVIEEIDGVDYVYISLDTALAQEESADGDTSDDDTDTEYADDEAAINYDERAMIGAVSDTEYSGSGVKVAVIDTSFDTDHEVFDGEYSSAGLEELEDCIDNGLLAVSDSAGAEDLYLNSKVIFAYDYAGDDTDLDSGETHGTSVAGLIAGSSGSYAGVANDAELMLLKVYDETSGTISDTVLLTALDDAALLGADIINLSLNTQRTDTDTVFADTLFKRLYDAGIFVSVAAGNYGSDTDYETSHVDYGETGLYALSDYVFVSTSVKNTVDYRPAVVFNDEEKIVPYTALISDGGETGADIFDALSGSYEYIYIDDIDSLKYSKTRGRIVVLSSAVADDEVLKKLDNYNAAAVLILTEDGTPPAIEEIDVPVAAVDEIYADFFESCPEGQAEVDEACLAAVESGTSGLSDYAPFGTEDSLKMGIDAAAVGDGVYVPTAEGDYGTMSGTSAAAAEVAGAAAVLKSYIDSDERFADLNRRERNILLYSLLTSTAEPEESDDGLYASTRLQGGGVINLESALRTGAYVSVASSTKPKADRGEFNGSSFSFAVRLYNITDEDLTYTIEKTLQADSAVEIDGVLYTSPSSESVLAYSDFTAIKSSTGANIQSVTVEAGGWVDISFTVTLDEDFIESLNESFPNGFFVDGYVSFLCQNEDGVDLSVPFMAFCGDWQDESAVAIDEDGTASGVSLYTAVYDSSSKTYRVSRLGSNMLTGERSDNLVFSSQWYENYLKAWQISSSTDYSALLLPSVALERSAEDVLLTISDSDGTSLYSGTLDLFRTSVSSAAGLIYQTDDFPQLKEGEYQYTVTVSSSLQAQDTEVSYDFTVDKTSPQAVSSDLYTQNDRVYLTLSAEDNTAVQGFMLYAAVYDANSGAYCYADCLQTLMQEEIIDKDAVRLIKQEQEDGTVSFTYDITDLEAILEDLSERYMSKYGISISDVKIAWAAVDYAWNMSEVMLSDIEPSGSLTLQFLDSDGEALVGVRVQVDDYDGISDENGEIYITDMELATYAVRIVSSPISLSSDKAVFEVSLSLSETEPCRQIILSEDGIEVKSYTAQRTAADTADDDDTDSTSYEAEQEDEDDQTLYLIFVWLLIAALLLISLVSMFLSRKKRLGK